MDYLFAPERLETSEFLLRPFQPGDGALLSAAISSSYEHLSPFVTWARPDFSPEIAEINCRVWRGQYLLNQDFLLAIFSPDGKQLLGGTGYYLRGRKPKEQIAEIGMWLARDSAGKGLGTKVLVTLLKWGFSEWPWLRLYWHCDARNVASCRVAEKAGLTKEGLLRQEIVDSDGKTRRDMIYYAALKEEWHYQIEDLHGEV
jgi:RimJ/RimL family protein N-acetyltransferase